jgi:hypothetical protein
MGYTKDIGIVYVDHIHKGYIIYISIISIGIVYQQNSNWDVMQIW